MPKVRSERRSYRKSPGRQYGYEYEPLRSRSEQSQSGQGGYSSSRGTEGTTPGATFSQRPDPRRTRQLLRQNIIASKARASSGEREQIEEQEGEREISPEEMQFYNRQARQRNVQSEQLAQPRLPSTRELMEEGEEDGEWAPLDVDPELDYEDPLDEQEEYDEIVPPESSMLPAIPAARRVIPRASRRDMRPERSGVAPDYDGYEDYDEYYEEERPAKRRKAKKGKLTRRGLLVGLGAAAVGGAVYAAPRVPGALGQVGSNLEQQVQDAFNKGMAQGAEAARKEIITSLENLEGFTLEGAVTAARLTRVAYDVFVSPVIQFGASIATDFLSAMLKAFKTARMLLAGVYQDNTTLQAIQKVMETWVAEVAKMPKQLDAITQTDLDGAQAYLRALQRKIDEEKAKLNQSNNSTTPAPSSSPTPKTH